MEVLDDSIGQQRRKRYSPGKKDEQTKMHIICRNRER